ncbi:MAG: twin-arginine translocation signal domain-containing protein [Halobacteriales archaeon]|nr:twin-arginine translocation signal domain-containing protein [Halobacteriales archaeon]
MATNTIERDDVEGKSDTNFRAGISRRDVLKGTAFATGALTFGVPLTSSYARAAPIATETIYLVDTGTQSSATDLFTVDLDTTPGEAILTLIETFGSPFQKVDAIAASPDGETVVLIDRNTKHLGEYDVSTGTFVDRGIISGLPNVTVLAAYGLNGVLYAASNSNNKLYSIDGVGGGVSPQANEVGTITGATVNGADIVVDSTGTMFLHTNNNDTLYTVDYLNPDGSGNIATTVVGTDSGSSLTGLAVRDAGQGDLVGSSRADNAIIVLDKTNGTRTSQSNMTLDGDPYDYSNGDMATGTVVDEGCVECTTEGLLAKYEFSCVEEVEGECVEYDFVFEKGDASAVTYDAGSYESKPGEAFEPVSATFGTDVCGVYAVVKAGPELEVQELITRDGQVTVEYIEPYAISYVEFYCDEEEAEEAADKFCINTRDLARGEEPLECPQDRVIRRGGSRDELDRGSGRLGRGIQRDSRTEQRGRNRRSRRGPRLRRGR